jgi:hypothetical protein
MPRCDACAYWQTWGTGGLCRFNPPVQIRDVRNDMVERWPPVAPDDWCGQFKQRPTSFEEHQRLRERIDEANTRPASPAPSFEDEF